jgi:hypothetical protein
MYELGVALALGLTGDLARSAWPDAPVVPDRPRKARRTRRPIVGLVERRTVASINEEDPCGT